MLYLLIRFQCFAVSADTELRAIHKPSKGVSFHFYSVLNCNLGCPRIKIKEKQVEKRIDLDHFQCKHALEHTPRAFVYRVVLNKHNRSFEQNVSAASPDLRFLFISPRVIVLLYLMITFAYVFLAENPRCWVTLAYHVKCLALNKPLQRFLNYYAKRGDYGSSNEK